MTCKLKIYKSTVPDIFEEERWVLLFFYFFKKSTRIGRSGAPGAKILSFLEVAKVLEFRITIYICLVTE